jgi:hypothetical protein
MVSIFILSREFIKVTCMPVKCFHIVTMEMLESGGPLLFPSKKLKREGR